jgi:hypothetical protein
MALRNAFENLSTEAKQDAIISAIGALLTDTELRASEVPVSDDYDEQESLADQAGAGAVLTFTFSAPVHMAIVTAVGADLVGRATITPADVPSATKGQHCFHEAPTYLVGITSEVSVFAPAGMTVGVVGLRRG